MCWKLITRKPILNENIMTAKKQICDDKQIIIDLRTFPLTESFLFMIFGENFIINKLNENDFLELKNENEDWVSYGSAMIRINMEMQNVTQTPMIKTNK